MSVTNVSDHKTIYGGFSNDDEWHKFIWDYSVDGGATSSDHGIMTAGNDLVVTDFYINIETGCSSAGSMVVDVGIGEGGTEFFSDKAVSALVTAGTIVGMTTAAPVRIPALSQLVMGIETAVATAGKLEFNLKLRKQ